MLSSLFRLTASGDCDRPSPVDTANVDTSDKKLVNLSWTAFPGGPVKTRQDVDEIEPAVKKAGLRKFETGYGWLHLRIPAGYPEDAIANNGPAPCIRHGE